MLLNSQPIKNGRSPAQNLYNCHLRISLLSVKLLLPQNSFINEARRPGKTTHSLPNIPQGNTVRIRTDEQNLWDKKGFVIK